MPTPLTIDTLAAAVAAAPHRTVLCCDFDGTLAPIVPEPAAARPLPAAIDALAVLTGHLGRVAVISGRPLSFLAPLVPPPIDLAGLYGLERRIDGTTSGDPDADAWRSVVEQAAADARDRFGHLTGVIVEPKGLSLTLHTRQAPAHAAEVDRWAAEVAARAGLERRPAKASVELHPPVATDKGTVVTAWAADVSDAAVVIFVGDDLGDLSAFDALDTLDARHHRSAGQRSAEPSAAVLTAAVAVAGPEAPAELLARADLVVEGPEGVLALLQRLVTAAS